MFKFKERQPSIRSHFKRFSDYIEELATEKPVVLAGLIAVATAVIVIVLSLGYWTSDFKDFLKNVAVEAHGMVFDLVVIGWFILWINKRAEKRLDIRRYQEEIDDYRYWSATEASHRIAGAIRRLNKNGITRIDLSNCHLNGAVLNKVDLSNANLSFAMLIESNLSSANLSGANLNSARIRHANLIESNLSSANLSDTILWTTNLSNANLSNANLSNADLERANLSNADLSNANLSEAILLGVDLSSIQELKQDQLIGLNPPFLCATKLPAGMESLSNRDCDRLPQILLDRYPSGYEGLDVAERHVNAARRQQQ